MKNVIPLIIFAVIVALIYDITLTTEYYQVKLNKTMTFLEKQKMESIRLRDAITSQLDREESVRCQK